MAGGIRARDTPISFEELYDKLLNQDSFKKRTEAKTCVLPITAQLNQKTRNNKGKWGNNNNYSGFNQNPNQNFGSRNFQNNFGHSFNNSNFHGNIMTLNSENFNPQLQSWCRQYGGNKPKIVCQLCDKDGHNAKLSLPTSTISDAALASSQITQ